MKKILKIGGYARVSHEEQKMNGFSIDNQIEQIEKWCEINGHQLFNTYIDEGFSAKNMKRPQLQILLSELDKIDAIVFTRLDRLTRNVLEANKMLEILNKHNVSIISISEGFLDTSTSNGLFMFNFSVNIAQHELHRGSERINTVIAYKVKQGQPITGNLPLGYRIENTPDGKKVVKDEEKIDFINDIFNHFLTHQSINFTTKFINEKYNFKKDYRSIKNTLTNPIYTGSYRDNPLYTDPYISEQTFNKIQSILKSNIRSTSNIRPYLFTGMFKCPECNYTLIGNSYVNTSKKRYYNYRCKNAYANKRCSNRKPISENVVEKYLLENLNIIIEKQIKVLNVQSTKSLKPKKQIKEIQSEMENLNYMFLKKRINQSQYDNLFEELEKQIKEIKIETPIKTNIETLKNLLNSEWKSIYEKLDRENKRAFWRSFISEIKCSHDYEIEIVFL